LGRFMAVSKRFKIVKIFPSFLLFSVNLLRDCGEDGLKFQKTSPLTITYI
jgi:hypothetical protein